MSSRLSPEARRHLLWETALDRLELDLMRAERLLSVPNGPAPEPWHEPELGGPIPGDLVERALALRDRQEQLQAALREQVATTREQHAFTDRVDRATGRRPALQFDVQA